MTTSRTSRLPAPPRAGEAELMFVLDTRDRWPGAICPTTRNPHLQVGYKNYKCNTMYYNPNVIYAPPKNADGTSFANRPSLREIQRFQRTTTVDLSTSFKAYDSSTLQGSGNDTAQAAYYYLYSGSQTLVFNQAPCTDSPSASNPFNATAGAPGPSHGQLHLRPGSTDERTNFANWYSYYRIRMNMMKSARALLRADHQQLPRRLRHHRPGESGHVDLLPADRRFRRDAKIQLVYQAVRQSPTSSTPLREALSRVGATSRQTGRHQQRHDGRPGADIPASRTSPS